MPRRIWIFAALLLCTPALAAPPALPLEEAKALAKKNSPTLQIAKENLYQAELIIDKAWVMVKPQVNATGTYTHYNTAMELTMPDFASFSMDEEACGPLWDPEVGFCFTDYSKMTIQKQDSFGFVATISQPIFLAQAISTIKNAYNSYDLAQINTENAEEYLLHSVEVAYYGALATKKFLEIARHAVEIRQEHLKVAQAKFEVGETPKITVLRAEIDVNQSEQDVKRAENSLALAKEVIRLLIGHYQDFSLVPPEPPKRPAETLEDYIQKALQQRRDLTSAKLELAIAEQLKNDAWYRFLPQLVATGMYRLSDVKGFTDRYDQWQIGLALSVPLYDGGLRYAYLKEAKSKIREATIKIEETEKVIASEIRQLWLKMEMAEANLIKSRRSVELAKEQVDLAKAAFEAGTSTNLEVLDANSIQFISEINETSEELNLHLAILKLDKAVKMFNPAGALSSMGAAPAGGAVSAPAAPSTSSMSTGGMPGM
jgi:outer membrane protein TolC